MKTFALSLLLLAVTAGTVLAQPSSRAPIERPPAKRMVMGRTELRNNIGLRPSPYVRQPGGGLLRPADAARVARLAEIRGGKDMNLRMDVLNAAKEHQARANEHRHLVMQQLVERAHGKALRPMPEELRMELLKHARRQALLARIDGLAKEHNDAKASAKVAELTATEETRHERRLAVLLAEPTKPAEPPPADEAEKPAESPKKEVQP